MDKYGKLIGPNTLRFERLLPGPIERVWQYLVDPEKRKSWFAGGITEQKPGGSMELKFYHQNLSPHPDPIPEKYQEMENGMDSSATVIACEEPHLLSFSWGDDGEVSIELSTAGDKVRLVLTHRKLPADRDQRIGTLAGWHNHLRVLEDRLAERDPEGFWKAHMRLEAEYAMRLDQQ